MKKQCIIFVIKNDEKFLIDNINYIYDLLNDFDLFFIIRQTCDRTEEILKSNNFFFIKMPYDSGYYEALSMGFEYIEKYNYETIIEFGEMNNISLSEIDRLFNIYKNNNLAVIFGSKHLKNNYSLKIKFGFIKKILRLPKLFIYLSIWIKINDPYTRIKIYDRNSVKCIKSCLDYKIEPYNFIILLYLWKYRYTEVGVYFSRYKKLTFKQKIDIMTNRFTTQMYTLFISSFIKRNKKNKCNSK